MSLPPAEAEEDISIIGQRHADRYPTVKKDFLIDPLDNNYGITSLATGLANVNPFTCMTAVSSTPQQTFEQLNAKCPDANRPVFDRESISRDTLPNCNGIATVAESSRTERDMTANMKVTTMSDLTMSSIQRFIDETSTSQYITNPHLVEGVIKRAMPLEIRTLIHGLARGLDLRSHFYLTIDNSSRVQLDWEFMSMQNVRRFLSMVQAVASRASDKSNEQRGFDAGMVSQQMYLEEDLHSVVALSDQSAAVSLAQVQSKVKTPWLKDDVLRAIWSSKEMSCLVVEFLLKQLLEYSVKASHKWHRRAVYLTEFLRATNLYTDHTKNEMTLATYFEFMHQALLEAATAWTLVKTFASPGHFKAMSMTSEQCLQAFQSSRNSGLSESRNTKRKTEHQPTATSTSTSTSISSKPPKPADPQRLKPAAKPPFTNAERNAWPSCPHCGNRHEPTQATDWVCPFVAGQHAHVNSDSSTPFGKSAWGIKYAKHPYKDKSGAARTCLQYKHILDDNGKYIDYLMPNAKPRRGESAVLNFLNNINIDSTDYLNPFMPLTVLPLNLLDRKEEERIGARRRRSKDGVLTSSGLIDSGAIDSDYISLTLFNSISNKLGYTLDTLHVDTVQTPFKHLPDIKCLGRCSLNIEIFNELTEVYETIPLKARVIDSPIDVIIGRPTIRKYKLLMKCHDQILDDTRIAHIEHSPLKEAEFLENDLWLQLNLIAGIAEAEVELKLDVTSLEEVASAPGGSATDASGMPLG